MGSSQSTCQPYPPPARPVPVGDRFESLEGEYNRLKKEEKERAKARRRNSEVRTLAEEDGS